jgi:segregation and condensation protein B
METLAIIAYKQPVLRSDVEYLRGVDSGGTLRTLLERRLIRVMGRKDLPGRPMIYGTTKQFLELFDLKDLNELPTLKDLKDLGETWPNDSR